MRIDVYLQSHGMAKSRTKAKEYIERGIVSVNGKTVTKAGYELCEGDEVLMADVSDEYVGRGAHKLEGALDRFGIDVEGLRCIDVGASTGGFTEVLLRRGALSVTAVDSGHGQLDPKLADDPRVKNIEGCNARYMTANEVGCGYELAVMDVSFISQTYIFEALFPLLSEGGALVTLVKPQFELDRKRVGQGVVKKAEHRYEAMMRVYEAALPFGFYVKDAVISPIKGGDGNTEYLFLIEKGQCCPIDSEKLKALSKQ